MSAGYANYDSVANVPTGCTAFSPNPPPSPPPPTPSPPDEQLIVDIQVAQTFDQLDQLDLSASVSLFLETVNRARRRLGLEELGAAGLEQLGNVERATIDSATGRLLQAWHETALANPEGRQLQAESTENWVPASDWRTEFRRRMAVVAGVPTSEVELTASEIASGTLMRYTINPPSGLTVVQLNSQISSTAGAGGLVTYFASVLDSSLTITGIAVVSSAALLPPPPSAPSPDGGSGGGLDGGALAGIIVGVLFGVAAIGGVAFLYIRRKKRVTTTTIIPDVGDRALIQPPALPPEVQAPQEPAANPSVEVEG